MSLKGCALHVAIVVRFWEGLCRRGKPEASNPEVRFSTSSLQPFGISRQTAARGLRALEEAGLLLVKRATGSKARVTVVEVHGRQSQILPPRWPDTAFGNGGGGTVTEANAAAPIDPAASERPTKRDTAQTAHHDLLHNLDSEAAMGAPSGGGPKGPTTPGMVRSLSRPVRSGTNGDDGTTLHPPPVNRQSLQPIGAAIANGVGQQAVGDGAGHGAANGGPESPPRPTSKRASRTTPPPVRDPRQIEMEEMLNNQLSGAPVHRGNVPTAANGTSAPPTVHP
jgi:hypothetical protein